MQRQKDRIAIDPARCMGCGVCRAQCPNKAIELVDAKGPVLPLDVDRFPGRDKNKNRTSH
jgi:ferredoxin